MFKKSLDKFYNYSIDNYHYLIKADANENILKIHEELSNIFLNVYKEVFTKLNLYPEIDSIMLRNTLAEFYNLKPDNFIIGNGSDQLIQIIIQAACEKSDKVVSLYPSFVMYKLTAQLNDNIWEGIEWLNEIDLPVEKIIDKYKNQPDVKVIFIDTPNNPTGVAFDEDKIAYLLRKMNNKLIVVDNAYADYCNNNYLKLLNYPNVILLKTFSKIGFAGIRCGYAISDENNILYLNKVKPPYNVNTLSEQLAINIIKNYHLIKPNIDTIIKERKRMIEELSNKFYVIPSQSNFISIISEYACDIYNYLRDNKISVKLFKDINLIRITICSPEENDIIIKKIIDWNGM